MDQKTFFQRAAVVLWLAASANRLACGAKQYVPSHKRADLVLSSAIYKKTLQLQADQRPPSAQWASQVREFESVRDFVSSSTLVVLTDLPFCLMFFMVIAWMGGSLVWVPVSRLLAAYTHRPC